MTEDVEHQNLRKVIAKAEAAEYHSKMSLLKLMKDTKKMRDEVTDDADKTSMDEAERKIMKKLTN